jgi:hypothetical protein
MSTADPPERFPALYLSDIIARRFTQPNTMWTSTLFIRVPSASYPRYRFFLEREESFICVSGKHLR